MKTCGPSIRVRRHLFHQVGNIFLNHVSLNLLHKGLTLFIVVESSESVNLPLLGAEAVRCAPMWSVCFPREFRSSCEIPRGPCYSTNGSCTCWNRYRFHDGIVNLKCTLHTAQPHANHEKTVPATVSDERHTRRSQATSSDAHRQHDEEDPRVEPGRHLHYAVQRASGLRRPVTFHESQREYYAAETDSVLVDILRVVGHPHSQSPVAVKINNELMPWETKEKLYDMDESC